MRASRRLGLVILWLAIAGASLYFLADAVVFGLSPGDPLTGRVRGCYTTLELGLGLLKPSPPLRLAQLSVALVGALLAGRALYRGARTLVDRRANST